MPHTVLQWFEDRFGEWRVQVETPIHAKLDQLFINIDVVDKKHEALVVCVDSDRKAVPKIVETAVGTIAQQLEEFKVIHTYMMYMGDIFQRFIVVIMTMLSISRQSTRLVNWLVTRRRRSYRNRPRKGYTASPCSLKRNARNEKSSLLWFV